MNYTKQQLAAAIEAEAQGWSIFFGVADQGQGIAARKLVMQANVSAGYLDPLLPYLPKAPAKRQAYDVTVRRIATGCDYSMRLFCVDAAAAERAAKDRARFYIGMRLRQLAEHEANGIAVFRVVSCSLSADQSRRVEV